MKRILTLLLMGILSYQAQSQVLFTQDFESGSLDPMIAIDVDGKTLDPNVAGFAGPTWKLVPGDEGFVVVSCSWFTPIGQADDWLISDSITITEANTFLIWDAYTPDANYRDGYEVLISTTDRQIASFTNLALNVPAELTSWNTRTINLDAYVGQTIYFAFRNHSFDKYLLYMDNIRVEVLKNNDVTVKSLNIEKYQPVNSDIVVKATIQNHGAQPLTSLIFSYTINGETFVDTITGLNIAPIRTTDITHNIAYPLSMEGVFQMNMELSMPNGVDDENVYDNLGASPVFSLSEQLPKKVVVEEATGTWCTWCPRGAVFMAQIAEDFAEILIPIAVHNGDPMAFPEYDGPFSNSVSGYPSGHVDRKNVDIDPSEFPAAVEAIQDRRVPVAVEVDSEYDPDTRTVSFKATGFVSVGTETNDFRFSAIITENEVTGTGSGYDQINAYAGGQFGPMGGYENLPNPVPASQMVYDFVARHLIGPYEGIEESIPDQLEAHEEFSMEFSYQVPPAYDPETMKAIVFVVDEETGEILNGDIEDIDELSVSVPLIPLGKSTLYPNPANDIMNLSVDFQTTDPVSIKIYDTRGRLIRDLGRLDLSQPASTHKIEVSDLHTGNYILELRHKNSISALPFTRI